MIGIDTNILVYAHRADSVWHQNADQRLTELAESCKPWMIAWSCLHEFLAIVTHHNIFNPPTPLKDAVLQLEYWLESPSLEIIGELADYWILLKSILDAGKISGPAIHDARIAAIYIQNEVKIVWTADRDFNRFPGIKAVNPLIAVD